MTRGSEQSPDAAPSDGSGNKNSNTNTVTSLPSSGSLKHSGSMSSLGDASGVAFLLGNHAKFGLAERCWLVLTLFLQGNLDVGLPTLSFLSSGFG